MSIALKLILGFLFLGLQCFMVLFIIGFFISGYKHIQIIGSLIWLLSAATVFISLIAFDPPRLTVVVISAIVINIFSNIMCFGCIVDDSFDHVFMIGWGVMIILSFIDSSKHRDSKKMHMRTIRTQQGNSAGTP